MKLHELRPAEGSRRDRTRVGRGIAAGKGKTAGRGTKGQKARAGSSIPAWFEGGQTPLHIRIPKLRGFRNLNRITYEVVNVGAIAQAIERGRLTTGVEGGNPSKKLPVTVNSDLLRDAGLVTNVRRPLKILGAGEISVPVFVLADAFTKSAREKIEAAGGSVQVIEVPSEPLAPLGTSAELTPEATPGRPPREAARRPRGKASTPTDVAVASGATEPASGATEPASRAASGPVSDATEPASVDPAPAGSASAAHADSAIEPAGETGEQAEADA